MIKTWKRILFLLVLFCILPMKVWAAQQETVIAETFLREKPQDTAKILMCVEEGAVIDVLSQDGDWTRVSVDGREGYVRTDVLKILDSFGKEKSDGEESQIIDEKFDEEIIEVKDNTPIDIQNRAKIDYSVLGKDVEFDYYDRTLDEYVEEQLKNGRVTRYSDAVGDWVPLDYNNEEDRAYVKYYMDPKNFIDDPIRRLMFMKLNYQDVSVDALNSMLINKGVLTGKGSVFKQAAQNANIHPIYLVAHALLETGNGNSKLATGKMIANGHKTYNIFGIGAYDSNPNFYGAAYAYEKGWFSVDDAILGGASFVSKGYINHPTYKQNTLYSMKWRLEGPDTWHQYATDARWAHSQSLTIYNDLKKVPPMNLQYRVPVFREAK